MEEKRNKNGKKRDKTEGIKNRNGKKIKTKGKKRSEMGEKNKPKLPAVVDD